MRTKNNYYDLQYYNNFTLCILMFEFGPVKVSRQKSETE